MRLTIEKNRPRRRMRHHRVPSPPLAIFKDGTNHFSIQNDLPIGVLPFDAFDGDALSRAGALLDTTTAQFARPAGDTTKCLAVPYPDDTGAVQLLFSSPESFGLCLVRRSLGADFRARCLKPLGHHPT